MKDIQGQSWFTCDPSIRDYLRGLVSLLGESLADNRTGVYLHGSLATGSWFPPKSDMDILVVVDCELEPDRAGALNLAIARYSLTRPTVGDIELSAITRAAAHDVPAEMPFELHYSEDWRQRIFDSQVIYGNGKTDIDLQAHLLCVKRRGICLCGAPIAEVFGDVPWQRFMAAILDDFDWIAAGENIRASPYYGILNICRVLQALREDNRQVLSKLEGGLWGLEHLPEKYAPLIEQALAIYTSGEEIPESQRRTGGAAWDPRTLLAFRDYAIAERAAYAHFGH